MTTGLYEKYTLVNPLDLRCESGICTDIEGCNFCGLHDHFGKQQSFQPQHFIGKNLA